MRIVQVRSERDVTRLSAAVTLLALSFVTFMMVILYPAEEWPREILIGWPMTTLLAYGATRLIGRQMLRVHELNRELHVLLSRDRLTGVATRDHFFTSLARQPQRYGVTLMVDIDYFKQINDTHGHLTGDKVLAGVARLLANEVGVRDLVCRFGGEEFVIFLENATPVIARELAERFRDRVAASVIDGDGACVTVTVSVGGSLRHAAADIDEAIRQADEALYKAKALGRNTTVMARDLILAMDDRERGVTRPAA